MDFCLENLETGFWKWFKFPISEEKVRQELNLEDGEYAVVDNDIGVNHKNFEYISIRELNEFVEKCEEIPSQDMILLEYFMNEFASLSEFINEFSYDEWWIIEANNDEEFGWYFVDEGAWYPVSSEVYNYLDFEAIGRDIRISDGFVEAEGVYMRPN